MKCQKSVAENCKETPECSVIFKRLNNSILRICDGSHEGQIPLIEFDSSNHSKPGTCCHHDNHYCYCCFSLLFCYRVECRFCLTNISAVNGYCFLNGWTIDIYQLGYQLSRVRSVCTNFAGQVYCVI